MTLREILAIDVDAYWLQRRPHVPQVVLADASRGIMVVDAVTGEVVRRLTYPAGYPEFARVDGVAIRADGARVVAFNDEPPSGCDFDLQRGTATILDHLPWPYTAGAPIDWRGDTLWVKAPSAREYVYFTEQPDGLHPSERLSGAAALQLNAAWCRAGDRVRRAGASVQRTDADLGQFLVTSIDEQGRYRVGRIGWVDQPDRWLEVVPRVIDVAMAGDQFITLHEGALHTFTADDILADTLPAPDGTRFLALDTVVSVEGTRLAVVLAANLDGRGCRLFVHQIAVNAVVPARHSAR